MPLVLATNLEHLLQPYVIFWVVVGSVLITASCATAWTLVRVREERFRAVAHLAEKGYSAEEIERLVDRKSF